MYDYYYIKCILPNNYQKYPSQAKKTPLNLLEINGVLILKIFFVL